MNKQSIQAFVPPSIKTQLADAAWRARTSLSAYCGAILEAHCQEGEPESEPALAPPARRLTPDTMKSLASLGYGPDDLGRLSAPEIERIVSQRIARPR
jgi:hypothetical protein